jgi:hypothetical protein
LRGTRALSGREVAATMGLLFHSLVKLELRMKTGFFRFALVYPAVYGFIFFSVVVSDSRFLLRFVLVPLHLLCIVCLLYVLYFVSKCLVLVQTGKPVSFSEYAGPFFLLWFFPIGIWIIQRKVNELFAQGSTASSLSKTGTV